MTENAAPPPDLIDLTADVVATFVANNTVAAADLPGLIAATHAAFAGASGAPAAEPPAETFKPAVTARKSLADRDHILSMIDGKPYRSLTRHLGAHGLTPAEYRARYNLPADYPMVAPGYSEARSAMAKAIGLGRKAKAQTPPAAPPKAAPKRNKAAAALAKVLPKRRAKPDPAA